MFVLPKYSGLSYKVYSYIFVHPIYVNSIKSCLIIWYFQTAHAKENSIRYRYAFCLLDVQTKQGLVLRNHRNFVREAEKHRIVPILGSRAFKESRLWQCRHSHIQLRERGYLGKSDQARRGAQRDRKLHRSARERSWLGNRQIPHRNWPYKMGDMWRESLTKCSSSFWLNSISLHSP